MAYRQLHLFVFFVLTHYFERVCRVVFAKHKLPQHIIIISCVTVKHHIKYFTDSKIIKQQYNKQIKIFYVSRLCCGVF